MSLCIKIKEEDLVLHQKEENVLGTLPQKAQKTTQNPISTERQWCPPQWRQKRPCPLVQELESAVYAHREKSPLKQLSIEEEASIDVLVTDCEFELHTQVDPRDEQLHPLMAPVKRTSLKP